MSRLIFFVLLLFSCTLYADKFEQTSTYQVCFTPGQDCTNLIVASINQAKVQVLVQAYSFTSVPIVRALVAALKRGVDVRVILDRSQNRPRGFSSAKMFMDYHIPIYIDYQPNIAHNKVMIIDSKTVVTGSFNFTRAAQQDNTENVIIISDSILAKRYLANWQSRSSQSQLLKAPTDQ